MKPLPILETSRLRLRPLELADAPQIQELFARWEIVRHLANVVPWPYPPDGAEQFIRHVALPAIQRGDEWIWTLRLRDDPPRVIGSIGLKRGEVKNRGFWMGQRWQGRGLMSEAADAVTDYWFDVLGFEVLRVPKAVANTASRRISARGGMRVIATMERDYVSGRLPSEVWEITAAEWRARRQRRAAGGPE